MKARKLFVILAVLSVFLLLLGLFFPWSGGDYTGERTVIQNGNNIHIYAETESISGWRYLFTGLTPACIASTVGPTWTVIPLVIPLIIILAIAFVLVPWRSRGAVKRDGMILIGLGVLYLVVMFSWTPTCPAEIIDKWNAGPYPGPWANLLGVLMMFVTGAVVLLAKPPKPAPVKVEYRICLRCKESVDSTLAVCPNCRAPMH